MSRQPEQKTLNSACITSYRFNMNPLLDEQNSRITTNSSVSFNDNDESSHGKNERNLKKYRKSDD